MTEKLNRVQSLLAMPNLNLAEAFGCSPGKDEVLALCDYIHQAYEYGAETDVNLETLVKKQGISCDKYALIVGAIMEAAGAEVSYIGVYSDYFGSHAFCISEFRDRFWFIDATANIVAQTDFNDLMCGLPAFPVYTQNSRAETMALQKQVVGLLENGGYAPSHLLYYYFGNSNYSDGLRVATRYWATPGSSKLSAASSVEKQNAENDLK